jgi:hypothetical protein
MVARVKSSFQRPHAVFCHVCSVHALYYIPHHRLSAFHLLTMCTCYDRNQIIGCRDVYHDNTLHPRLL